MERRGHLTVDADSAYREDFLRVAGGFAEEARRLECAGDLHEAANWWHCAGALYCEAARVAPDDVIREGHLAAAAECDRLARVAGMTTE